MLHQLTFNEPSPKSLRDFFEQRVNRVAEAATLVMVLDPGGRLDLPETFTQRGRMWRVIRYDENDLAFRKVFSRDGRVLVWLTGKHGSDEKTVIAVSSLTDVFRQADEILDCSLTGALGTLVPNETFPLEPVLEHATIISSHLGEIASSVPELHKHLSTGAVLDANSMRALVLHALAPQFQARAFLFRADTASQVLQQYARLAWSADWNAQGQTLLQIQAQRASQIELGELRAWFDVPLDKIARLVYLYRFLSRVPIQNVMNQIRGIGVLGFDPQPLERGMETLLHLWERNREWRTRIIRQAENSLSAEDIRRAADLIPFDSSVGNTDPARVADILAQVESPAFLYEIGLRLAHADATYKKLPTLLRRWQEKRPNVLNEFQENDSPHVRAAQALATLLDELSIILARLMQPKIDAARLDELLTWYVDGKFYEMELAHAQAQRAVNRLPMTERERFEALLRNLRVNIRVELDRADHALGKMIASDWNGFLGSKKLALNVLWDFIKTPNVQPTRDACLWFIVLDGMRYDTWMRVVRPQLTDRFEIKKENAYFSLLPSWTYIARTSLMAGQNPEHWKSFQNRFTAEQAQLAAKLVGLTENDWNQKLRFYSGMESDRTMAQFDKSARYPYNLLVFNLSDDNLHQQRDNVATLNESVQMQLNNVLNFLEGLIQPQDMVIVSSDHGFMEMDEGDGIPIPDEKGWEREMTGLRNPVTFRYIRSVNVPPNLAQDDVFTFEYHNVRDGKFTVPIGKKWFKRADASNTARYAHGGISFAEMVVPGAMMQLISVPRIEIIFSDLPPEIQADEGKMQRITLRVHNQGNRSGAYEFETRADTDTAAQIQHGTLQPGADAQHTITFKPVVRRGDGTTRYLQLALTYADANAAAKKITHEIPVRVKTRTDVVEISFGGLDDLDR